MAYSVYDIRGKLVFSGNTSIETLDLRNEPDGVYIILLEGKYDSLNHLRIIKMSNK
jgi:hypothetical protein